MGEDRDESEGSEAAADLLGNDEDTEKGEVEAAAEAKPKATAEADDEADAKANDEADAKADDEADAKADDEADATPKAEAEAKPKADAKAKDEAQADDEDDAEAKARADDDGMSPAKAKPKPTTKDKGGASRWWLVLLAVLVVEFYVYGRRGEIEVCVGKADVHDFTLIGQERTDENRWKFPRCESRVNLGLRTQYDELVEDGTNVACRGATLFRNRGEGPQCAAGSDGWTKQVETSYIWPWDSRYYKHLLWFLFE